MTFKDRKKERKEYYEKFVKGRKLVECTACSGYKYYCGRPCGSCDGTGKERSNQKSA